MLVCFWQQGDHALAGEDIPAPEICGSGMVAEEHGWGDFARYSSAPRLSIKTKRSLDCTAAMKLRCVKAHARACAGAS